MEPRQDRVFWTYWTAGTISSVGSAVSAVALPLTAVLVLHASALEVGLLTAASYVAWIIIGLPAGVLVARMPLRTTQVAMDLARTLALASVPLAWWLDRLTLAQLVVVALVESFAGVVFDVGNMTLLPAIVSKDELGRRNSLMSGTHATTQLGGPSLGGLLVQLFGAVPAVLADAISYLVSAALISRLPDRRVPQPAPQPGNPTPMREMIHDGWRFVTRHPVMGPTMWEATATNLVCGALMALTPLYLVRDLRAAPGVVGLLIASDGMGSLAGAVLAGRVSRRFGTARSILVAGSAGAVVALLLPAGYGVPGMVLFAIGNAGFAAGVVIGSVNTRTFRQTATPPELLSRVMATVRFVSWGAIPVGALAAGATATLLGVRAALWLTCFATFLPVAVLLASPVRTLRDLPSS